MDHYISRLVEVVAKSFIERLLGQPDVDSLGENTMTDFEAIYDHSALVAAIQERIEGCSTSIVEEIIKKAKERAARLFPDRLAEHQAEASVAPKPNAASIFLNQLNGGGGLLDGFVTWEMIQEEATDNEGKIDRLQMIQYIEDILPDWENDLRPFLTQFETLSVCRLYRLWFGKARATNTAESQAFQRDLTTDLFQLAVSPTSEPEVSRESFRHAVEMFIDLVNRSVADCYHVGKRLWHIVLTNPRQLLSTLVNLDPYATSFSLWLSTNEMTVETTLKLLGGTSSCIEDVGTDLSMLLKLVCSLSVVTHTKQFYFTLGVLHSIINCTRVTNFPWDMVGNKHVADVFELFLIGVMASKDKRHLAVCVDALDTLERGILDNKQRLDCRDQYRIVVSRFSANSAADSNIECSISKILERLQGEVA